MPDESTCLSGQTNTDKGVRMKKILLLLLIAICMISYGCGDEPTAPSNEPALSISPNPASSGQTLNFTLKNTTSNPIIILQCSYWGIYDINDSLTYGPICPAVVVPEEISIGGTKTWTWDQNGGLSTGNYSVKVSYTMNSESKTASSSFNIE